MKPFTRYQLACAPVFAYVYMCVHLLFISVDLCLLDPFLGSSVFITTVPCACVWAQLGLDLEELEEIEEDAGLGNGGLGRLAGESLPAKNQIRNLLKAKEN